MQPWCVRLWACDTCPLRLRWPGRGGLCRLQNGRACFCRSKVAPVQADLEKNAIFIISALEAMPLLTGSSFFYADVMLYLDAEAGYAFLKGPSATEQEKANMACDEGSKWKRLISYVRRLRWNGLKSRNSKLIEKMKMLIDQAPTARRINKQSSSSSSSASSASTSAMGSQAGEARIDRLVECGWAA
eukprot:5431292-Alexandrium_andersonii.AAC.1